MTDKEKPPLTPPVKKWLSDTIRRHRASFLLGTFPPALASSPVSPEAAAWLTPSPSVSRKGSPVWSHGTYVQKVAQLKAPLDAGDSDDPANLDILMWKFDRL